MRLKIKNATNPVYKEGGKSFCDPLQGFDVNVELFNDDGTPVDSGLITGLRLGVAAGKSVVMASIDFVVTDLDVDLELTDENITMTEVEMTPELDDATFRRALNGPLPE